MRRPLALCRMLTLRPVLTLRVWRGPVDRQAGFTLFELIVVVCIVAVMAGILLNRLRVYEEAAEKAAMQQTAAAIKSALQMRVASYMIGGRDKEIENLRNENPVNWLQENPADYAGEFYADAYARVRPGSWYFDLTRRELIYVVNLGDHFKPGPDARKWVRYRVSIKYENVAETGGAPRKVLSAVSIAPVQPYVWF
ncbi:MAG: type II secretion system protein [Betaproteobacteria bacterium]|nr:MAG: type II secretion system protein [Betaproteobacteria bacterium]